MRTLLTNATLIDCVNPAPLPNAAVVLSGADAELLALEARCDKTRALKQEMMQALLTGRTRLG